MKEDRIRRSIILNIGTSCFVQCIGCYNHFGNSVNLGGGISFREILDFAEKARDIGYGKITVGGGDPLSRPDLFLVLRGLKELGFSVNLDTVGTAFLQESSTIFYGKLKIPKIPIDSLKQFVSIVGIPLDGSTNEIVAAFRTGRPHILTEQIDIIKRLVGSKIPTCVNTVVSSLNVHDLDNIYDIVSRLNVEKWQLFQFMPIGPLGSSQSDRLQISEEDFNRSTSNIIAGNENQGSRVTIVAKSITDRQGAYLIVDDQGGAWSPTGVGRDRVIFGSIKESGGRSVLEHAAEVDLLL